MQLANQQPSQVSATLESRKNLDEIEDALKKMTDERDKIKQEKMDCERAVAELKSKCDSLVSEKQCTIQELENTNQSCLKSVKVEYERSLKELKTASDVLVQRLAMELKAAHEESEGLKREVVKLNGAIDGCMTNSGKVEELKAQIAVLQVPRN